MKITIDAAGNIIGKYPGTNPKKSARGFATPSAIATGSQIDTVPCGGHYDGAYGVLAGLEVVSI